MMGMGWKKTIASTLLAIALLLSSGAPPPAQAAQGAPPSPPAAPDEALYREIAGDLRCPTCAGLSILESASGFSAGMRDEVRLQLTQHKTKEEILHFFVERYGPWILRKPPFHGLAMVLWVLPAMLALAGCALALAFFLRRHPVTARSRAHAPHHPTGAGRTDDELRAELLERVARLRAGQKEHAP